ncbi:MAG: hypothetical protein M1609_14440 [Firmicutes bacterium]|nr:hypothetical protein [Bacillota bacterium]
MGVDGSDYLRGKKENCPIQAAYHPKFRAPVKTESTDLGICSHGIGKMAQSTGYQEFPDTWAAYGCPKHHKGEQAMGEARERDELLRREKVIGLFRKWLVYVLGILFLWILYPTEFANFNLRLFFTFGAIYFVYTLYVLTLAGGLLFRVLWYLLYIVELAYISFLIFYSRGMDSNLFTFRSVLLHRAYLLTEMLSKLHIWLLLADKSVFSTTF